MTKQETIKKVIGTIFEIGYDDARDTNEAYPEEVFADGSMKEQISSISNNEPLILECEKNGIEYNKLSNSEIKELEASYIEGWNKYVGEID